MFNGTSSNEFCFILGALEECTHNLQCARENEVCHHDKPVLIDGRSVYKQLCLCDNGFERDAQGMCQPGKYPIDNVDVFYLPYSEYY